MSPLELDRLEELANLLEELVEQLQAKIGELRMAPYLNAAERQRNQIMASALAQGKADFLSGKPLRDGADNDLYYGWYKFGYEIAVHGTEDDQ